MDIPSPPPPQPSPQDVPPPGPSPADARSTVAAVPAGSVEPSGAPAPAGSDPLADTAVLAGPPPVPPAHPRNPLGTPSSAGRNPFAPPPFAPPPFGPQPPYGAGPQPAGQPGAHPYLPYPYAQGPYVQGPYGQPAGPYGWYPVQRTTNGLAIASLVISLSLFCLPLLAVVLGICALRQISRRGQSGRGLAVAGIVINGFATLLVALFVALGVAGAFDDGDTVVQDVKVGQCFDTVGGSALSDWADNVVRAPRVDVVPCRGEHDAEAFAVVPLGSEFGPGYPGQGALLQLATQECRAASDGYLGSVPYPDGMETYFSLPSRGVWNRGDHSVSCFYGSPDGQVAGSVLNGGGDQSGLGV